MSEWLVQKIGRSSPDPLVDCRCLKAGMAITVQENGWPWSEAERTNPEWEIFTSTMTVAEAQAYLTDEPGSQLISPFQQIRARRIDFDALPAAAAARLRAPRGLSVAVNRAAIIAATRTLPPIPNPMVLG